MDEFEKNCLRIITVASIALAIIVMLGPIIAQKTSEKDNPKIGLGEAVQNAAAEKNSGDFNGYNNIPRTVSVHGPLPNLPCLPLVAPCLGLF